MRLFAPMPAQGCSRRSGRTIARAVAMPPCVERLCYLSERACARLLSFANDGQHVDSVSISFGLHCLHSTLAGGVEAWVTKGHPAILCCRDGLPGPCRDERAPLLGQPPPRETARSPTA
jgi:hypothetical protein